jgi:hypothetical protein
MLYLVRDPRATLQSRKGRDWSLATPSCHEPKTLYGDFPDRIKFLLYKHMVEDMDKSLGEFNVCAENVKSWFKSWVFHFTFQAYILPHTLNCMYVC